MKKRRNQIITTIVLIIALIFGLSIYGSQTNKQAEDLQNTETSQQAQSSNQADGENKDDSEEKISQASDESDQAADSEEGNEGESSEDDTSKEETEAESQANEKEKTQATASSQEEDGATVPPESGGSRGQEKQNASTRSESSKSSAENRQAQSSGNSSQSGQASSGNEVAPQETVQVTITTGSVRGRVLSRSVPYQEGDTALDVSLRAMQAGGISYSLTGAGATAYMSGIDGLYEFDEGPLSGWKIAVNGSDIDRSSGAYPVSAGSQVTWYYTTNYLED